MIKDCQNRFNCGFAGAKGNVYEGGIRIPLIIRWPGGLDGGRHFDEMVHFVDWLPTLAEATGGNPWNDLPLDGQSILPVLILSLGCRRYVRASRLGRNRARQDGEHGAW